MGRMSENSAYQTGTKIANLWQSLRCKIKAQDLHYVNWSKKHGLPAWTGHIPVTGCVLLICSLVIFSSLILAGCLIFIWAIAFIIRNISSDSSQSNANQSSIFTQEDDFIINSALNGEYDGAPYKSPGEE